MVNLQLGFARGAIEQSNRLQKVQAKLILLLQKVQMAELLTLQCLLEKTLWTTLKSGSPQNHEEVGQSSTLHLLYIGIKFKGPVKHSFFPFTQDAQLFFSF